MSSARMAVDARGDLTERLDPLEDFPPKRSVPYLTLLLARLFQADFLSRIAATGVAPAQAFVLRELWQQEPLSQVELSRRLDIGKATVGQTLNRLERAGLIIRRRIRSDRRISLIHLTDKGRALREPLAKAARAQVKALRKALGPDDLNQLTDSLARAATLLRNDVDLPSVEIEQQEKTGPGTRPTGVQKTRKARQA